MRNRLAAVFAVAALLAAPALALANEDLLALVAMPLAVAAVSEMSDVPTSELVDVVTLLNDAAVPPPQFIEVVRYAPAALVVENDQPDFVEFVRVQRQQGLAGLTLVDSLEERIRVYVPDARLVTATPIVDIDDDFIPVVVRNRVAQSRSHPHGGPPGQIKKEIGVQTGAEVVHGDQPGRGHDRVTKGPKHHGQAGKGQAKGHGKGKGKGKHG